MTTKKRFSLIVWVFLVTLLLAPAVQGAECRWQPLFDGKTIDWAQWQVHGGFATYHVEDGVIVGTTAPDSPNTFLCTKKAYTNFILEFEVLVDPKLNSGVQIRSGVYEKTADVNTFDGAKTAQRTRTPGTVYGYQVEISNEEAATSGSIYDEARRGWLCNMEKDPIASKAFKDNQWNHYRIVCIGDLMRTWVNGVAVASLVDNLSPSGLIGLQVHSVRSKKPLQVRWKNLKIIDLGDQIWKPLFDGVSTNGWEKKGGNGTYTIQDGVIFGQPVGLRGENTFLCTKETYSDFILEYEAWIHPKMNSGVQIRSDVHKEEVTSSYFGGDGKVSEQTFSAGKVYGYQIELDPTDRAWSGGLYEEGLRGWLDTLEDNPAAQKAFHLGQWNHFRVEAIGNTFKTWVNGVPAADCKDDRAASGFIGLQVHAIYSEDAKDAFAQWRNLRIQDLSIPETP